MWEDPDECSASSTAWATALAELPGWDGPASAERVPHSKGPHASSWRLVAAALEDLSCDRLTSTTVSAFLRDGYVHQFFREPTRTFAPPTNQTKLDFETKTGAINVVPSPNDPYDLDTIKGDAQWLSKNVKTNEVAALRIVLIEYQSRAHSHLTGPLSTQDVANIQEAAGVGDAQASAILAALNATTIADAESTWTDFESETTRRQRLLATYLSERRSFLGAIDALLAFLLHSCSPDAGSELKTLRDGVLQEAFGFDGDATKPDMARLDALAPTYIRTLDDCFVRIHAPPDSLDLQILTEQLQVDWVRTALTEAIHAMALIFQILDLKASHFATPEIVTQWFALMDACEFFAPVTGGHELLAELAMPLHSLISAISLKVLNIDRTLLYLDQDVDLLEDEEPYLASSDALTKIHTTVSAAASVGLATTMPLVFAWSLILHQMHIGYQERAERRDLLQNQRAQAGFELEYEPSSTSGRQRRNSAGSIVSIEASSYDVFLASQQLERNIEPAENMARMATAQGQLYGLLAEMAVCLGSGQSAAFRPVLGARARLVFQDLLKRSVHYVGYQSEPVECLLSILSGGSQYWDISPEISSNGKASLEIYTRMLDDDTLRTQYSSQSQSRFPYEFLPFSSICRILSAALVTDKENSEIITTLLVKTPSLTVDWDPRWDRSYELVFEEENTNSFRLTRDIDLFDATSKSNRRISPEEKSTMPRGTYGRFVTDVGRVAKLEFEHSTLALFGKRLEVNLTAGAYDTGLGYLTVDELIEGISLLATVLRTEALKSSKTDADRGLRILTEASRLLPQGKDILSIICDTLDSLVEEELADLDGPKIAAMSSCLQFLYAALPVCPGRVWAYMARCALINSDTRSGRLSRITANLDMFAERYDLLLSAVRLFSSLVESAMTSAAQRRSGTIVNGRSKGEENPWLGASDKIVSRVSLSIAQTSIDVFENSATWRFPSEVDRSVLVRDVVGIMHKLVTYAHSIGPRDAQKSLTGSLAPAAGYIVESFLSTSSSSLRFQPLLATLLAAFQIPDTTLYQRRSQIVSERLTTVLAFATTLLRVADYLNQASTNIQTQLFKSACVVARLPAIRHSFRMPAIALLNALVESAGKSSGEPPSLLGYLGPQVSRSFIQIVGQLDMPFDRTPEVASTWKFFSTILRNRQQWMANCLLTGKTPREALKGEAKIAQLTAGSVLSTALEKLRSIRNTSSQETLAILDFFTSAQNYWPWTIFAMQRDKAFLQELRAYVRDLKAPARGGQSPIPAEACYQNFAQRIYRSALPMTSKRTLLVPRDLGSQYFYALDVAESMLGHDAGWAGSRHNGFRREMEAANLNLSLVEAEVPAPLTGLRHGQRASRTRGAKTRYPTSRTLLKILFVVLRGSKHSNNAAPQKPAAESPVAVTQLVLTTLDRVVARSFRNLAALVHEPDAATTPEDLALITAILQACLSVPGIEQCQLQVLNIMSSHDILQVATSLFSWSDRLADKGDPIYGELALLLLLELSALPALAEQLACDGLLGHLTSAKLAGFMRRANVSPLADNAGAARCYAVWAKGVLPLLLNILAALGATIAPEVAYVLNQFPNLLRGSVARIEAPGLSRTVPVGGASGTGGSGRDRFVVTLVAVSEVHSLALLTRVLGALGAANSRDIPEVVWDAGAVLENVEFWAGQSQGVAGEAVAVGSAELTDGRRCFFGGWGWGWEREWV
ncbi:hypothetical protein CHGG_05602 [Chaetomium globosum CBS 148.51]|uniref:Nucleoporin NUP188 n=1 Tax=Chaetomium globosum (strain ATCC 6205 / CBS 148.51 / DSM 1962 / NBRC 6347 / NRRL 1970) TaxID=306901 RepID=Q2H6W3_CHAGB|nr:uncharacterized protein CHGG_05602 [Chaetomium globosum CBS 148.51]EAQ88983.1 hypothetical protein CHGG_05602 [Chaetomium globosum CBS 148.51]